jgi:hypothetical protein
MNSMHTRLLYQTAWNNSTYVLTAITLVRVTPITARVDRTIRLAHTTKGCFALLTDSQIALDRNKMFPACWLNKPMQS